MSLIRKLLRRSRTALLDLADLARQAPSSKRATPPRGLDVCELEDRLLFSATPLSPEMLAALSGGEGTVAIADEPAPQVSTVGSGQFVFDAPQASDPSATPAAQSVDVVLIDSHLQDSGVLTQAVESGAQLFLYDSSQDSAHDVLASVADWAESTGNKIGSLSILSHGVGGAFELGSQWVSLDTLDQTAADWQRLAQSFSEGANIELFGCNVAGAGSEGQQLLDRIAQLTGADVFASDDTTGFEGDWQLEAASAGDAAELATGLDSPFSYDVLATYNWALAAPTVTMTSAAVAYTEGDAATLIDSGITLAGGTGSWAGATITISSNYVNGEDVLAFTNQLGITGSWDANTGVLTLTGTTTRGNYQTALRSVTYVNTSDQPSTATRTITVQCTDTTPQTATDTRNITVGAIDGVAIWTNNSTTALNANWTGSTFGTSSNVVSSLAEWQIIQMAEAPTRNEIIAVGIDGSGIIRGAMWDGSSWTAFSFNDLVDLTTPGYQSFQIAYEQQSGDAMLVWANGTTGSTPLSYRTWNGSTWSSAQTITAPVSGEAAQLRLATNPGGDQMVLAVCGVTAANDYALVWDGSSWGNGITLDTSTGTDRTEIYAAYESHSGQALVVYDADATGNSLAYRTWDGTNWSTQQSLSAPSGVSSTSDVNWTVLASDRGSDRIALGVVADTETWVAVWDGSAWTDAQTVTTTNAGTANLNVAVAFETNSGDLLAAYGKSGSNYVSYRTWTSGGGWSSETATDANLNLGAAAESLRLYSDPNSNKIMLGTRDAGKDVRFALWTGSAWDTAQSDRTGDTGGLYVQSFDFVWDDNNRAPTISTTSLSMAENSAVAGTVASSDADGNARTYSIIGGADQAKFTINSSTGALTFVAAPNYESPTDSGANNVYDVIVLISDGNGASDSQAVAVTVTDVDEFDVTTPSDANAAANAVNENAANGTTVGITASASDADGTTNTVTYSLTDSAGGRFAINSSTGVVTVADGTLLNREAAASHNITVRATSADGSTADAVFTINLSDVDEFDVTAPSDANAAANAVNENAANGTTVGITASASDADATTNAVTYSLTDSAGGRFAINSSTGVVTVADGTLLNREAAASHNITVRATSADGSTADTNFTINLNDVDEFDVTAPADANAAANAVNENAANGTTVGITASASDADATTNAITYSLTDSAGGRFAINSSTGVVTVADGTLLNRETAASHNITVRATSADGSTADTIFTINLNDLNEFDVTAPADTNGAANAVSENAANGTTVGITASASDADATTNAITYSLTDSAGGRFAINSSTGVVTVADGTLLNREAAASHNITVRATSADGSTADVIFTINLNDVDEFDVGAISDINAAANSLSEIASVGDAAGITASATDADATSNVVTYTLDDNAGGLFAINSLTGVVTLAGTLDFEAQQSHDITVRANSADGSYSTQNFTIQVTDANEAGVGAISDTDAAANQVAENSSLGASVGITAHGSDPDGTDVVTYSLDDDAGGRFAIDANSGAITIAGAIDREAAASYNVIVRATSTDSSFNTRTFTINILDVDEFDVTAPADANAAANAVNENAANGTTVGITASANDADATTNGVTYSLTDDAGGRFAIDATTGVVTVADGTLLNREASASHDITVRATSADGSTADTVFTINVNDVDEFNVSAPADANAAANAVSENAANGTTVGVTAQAADADATTNSVTYSLADDAGGRFAINTVTGVVTVANGTLLNREAAASHDITVRATSADGSTADTVFTINLNDVDEFDVAAPSDSNAAANAVNENAANGTTVGITASASDADATTNSVTYSLTDDAGGRFAIDATTGVVTVADGTLLNREAAASHDITVRATSADGSTADTVFTININDVNEFNVSAPSDANAAANAVNENAANGTTVGITASASDADATTNSVTYSLTDDAGGRFAINAATGVVTVADGTLLNREAAASHDITVRATSADGSTADTVFTINVNDVDEFDVTAPADTNAAVNAVNENTANGIAVGITASASDADATTNTVTYSLTDSAGGRFAIDATTGVVTVADGTLLNRETAASHDITVRATSADGSTADTVFTINVSDVDEFDVSAPADANAAANAVNENAANGTTMGITASASDADATTNSVTYSLTDSAGGRFAINATTGVVTVADGTLLNREAAASHDITVRATSADGSTADTVFMININDVDEFDVSTPADSNVAGNAVNENAANGTTVGITASASDADATTNSITYSLTDDAGGRFAINATTGIVTVADGTLLNREAAASHDITVRATSADGSTADTVFTINVNDVDEFDVTAPADANAAANAVNENAANGTTVGITASASDADATTNSVTYSLTDDAGGRFAIDATTGVVTVADGTLLNREAAASHNITVRATSSDGTTADTVFTININDVDEFDVTAPVDANAAANAVNENAANGTTVGITASASDADATTNSVTYSLTDDAGGRFAINATTGVVTVADGTLLNREAAASHNITVRATSADGSTADTAFTININDVDEFDVTAPADANAAADAVNENAANGTTVGITASASDADATTNSVTYSLTDSAGGRFAINAATGVVTVADGTLLNREVAASHNITVRATSADGSTADTVFTININDVDEFDVTAPADANAAANAVNENAANGTTVGITASASDADATTNSVTYSLTDDAGGRFAINATTGVVTVADGTLLNREAAASHNITVRATSADGSTADTVFTINLLDVDEFDVSNPADSHVAANAVSEYAANGTLVGITASASDADATTNTVTFSLTDNAGGRFAINATTGVVTVADGTLLDFESAASHNITVRATSADGSTADTTFTINVLNVNEAPVNSVPGAQNTSEDTPLIFSAANGNLISISDVDDAGGLVQVTLTATNGTVTLSGTGGLTFSAGDGTADATLTFSGTVADINTALAGLSFGPTADFNGAASLQIVTNDLGNTGSGGPLSDSDTVNITVSAVNDAPVITLPASWSTNRNVSATFSSAFNNAVSISDVDAGNGSLQVTLAVAHGTLTLSGTSGLSFSVGDGTADTSLAFSGTLANINAALDGLVFTPTTGYVGLDSLQVTASDQGNSGAGGAQVAANSIFLEVVVESRVNTTTANNQTEPAVAMSATGAHVVVWTSDNQDGGGKGIYGQLYDASGVKVGGEFRVNTFTAGDQVRASVAMDDDGNFVVTWASKDQDGNGFGIYAQRYNAAGVAQGSEFRVNVTTNGPQDQPAIAMDQNGNFVVVWKSDQTGTHNDIYARLYDSTGTAQGGEFRVNTDLVDTQDMPAVAMDAAGNFVIAWKTNSKIDGSGKGVFAQRYDAAGVAQGGQFQVNTTSAGDQDKPTVAMADSGEFIIAWKSGNNQDGDKGGIFAQRYSASGTALGGEFQVNTTTFDNQDWPTIGIDGTGGFTIAWSSNNQDGNGKGIYAQRYLADGSVIGGEFRVSSTTANNQDIPALAMSTIGDLCVVWQGNGVGDSSGIFRQFYGTPNDAPVNSIPGPQSTSEDIPLIFSAANGNLISISDVDALSSPMQVTLTATNGTITLSGTVGLTFIAGDGTADGLMTFTGTMTNINAALAGLVFTPSANFNGAATLQIITDDLGNHGSGGALSDTDVVAITVTPVNDAPINSVPNAQSTNEDTALVFSAANGNPISLGDVDAVANPLQVTLTVTQGTLSLGGFVGITFVSGSDGAASFTISGTVADLNAALDGLTFQPGLHYNGADTLAILTDDLGNNGSGGALTDSDTVAITVTAVNDAPVNTVPAAQSTPEDTVLVFSAANGNAISVSDLDANGNALAVTLSVASGTLTLNGTTGLTILAGGNGTASITISGTVADLNAALDGLAYQPGLNFNGSDTLTMVTDDLGNTGSGGPLSDTDTVSITVTAVNDAPVHSVPGGQTTNEDTALVFSAANGNQISLGDVDAAANPLQVTLTVTQGTLSLGGFAGITFVSGSNGSASFTISGTVADLNAALDGLTFLPGLHYNGADTLTILTDDLGNSGSGGALTDSDTVAITVTAVNDAPVNTVPAAQSTPEDTVLVFSAANGNAISVSDLDANGSDLAVTLSVASGTLTLSGTTGLTILAGGNGTSSITIRGTVADLNAALDGLAYQPGLDFNGSDTLTMVTDDLGNTGSGGPLSDTDTVSITVTAVNDAPVHSVPGGQTTDEDTALVFSAANGNQISLGDVDAAANPLQVTLTVTQGTLSLGGFAGITFVSGSDGSASFTISGTVADLNAALDGLTFLPGLHYNGVDTLTILTNDLGNSGSGGALTDSDTVAITVTAVNDAPVNTVPAAQNTPEDTVLVFSAANGNAISVGDLDAGVSNLAVTLSVASGTLTLNGTAGLTILAGGNCTASFTIRGAVANLNAALDGLAYRPGLNFNGSDTLTMVTDDLGNTGSGGPLTDTSSVNITVTPVNDAPSPVASTFTMVNDEVILVSAPGVLAGAVDVEGDLFTAALVSGPARGVLVFNPDGSFSYTPEENFSGPVSFTFVVSDGSAVSPEMTVTIMVEPAGGPTWPEPGVDQPPEVTHEVNDDPLISPTQIHLAEVLTKSSDSPKSLAPQQTYNAGQHGTQTAAMGLDHAAVEGFLATWQFTRPQLIGVHLAPAFDLDRLGEASEEATLAESGLLWTSLDKMRETIAQNGRFTVLIAGVAVTLSTSLSVGYVLWAVRGGTLVSGMLSSMAVWRFIDPLPILDDFAKMQAARPLKRTGEEETLASLVGELPLGAGQEMSVAS